MVCKCSNGLGRAVLSLILIVATASLSVTPVVRADNGDLRQRIKHQKPLPPLGDPREKIDRRGFFFYMTAVIMEELMDIEGASKYYQRALEQMPESYEVRYSYARTLYGLRKFAQTRDVLDGIVPEDAAVYHLTAASYRAQGKERQARDSYLKAVALDSSRVSIYSFLAVQSQQAGDLDSAIWAYEHVARLKPDDYLVWFELGKLLASNGKVQAARRSFDSSIALNGGPSNMLAFVHLGDLFQQAGKPDSALSVYRQAHALQPDNIVLNRALSAYHLSIDSFAVALPYVRVVAEAVPDERASQHRLAVVYYVLDSLEAADSIFSILSRGDPGNPRLHYYLGRIAFAQDDFERARTEFTSVIQVSDSVYEGYIDLAFVYRRLGQPEKEFEVLQSGFERIQEPKGKVRILMALGAAFEQAGRIDESIAAFERLLDISPEFDPALNYLGYLLADRGERLDYAQDLISRAVTIKPDNAAYLDSYGWVHYRLGEWQQALEYLKQAAELDNDPTILDHLGDAYDRLKEPEQARLWWRKALELDPENQKIREKLRD